MARIWTLQWEAPEFHIPASGGGSFSVDSTTGRPVMDLDASTDEYFIVEGIVPAENTGATYKCRIYAMANTTTAADDARIDVKGECRTPNNNERGDADDFSDPADSGTMTFSTTAYAIMSIDITLTTNFEADEVPTAGDKVRLKFTRDADNGSGLDSLAVDLRVLAVEFWEET